jgi:membrane associated rhomboid family serine protease
MGIYDRDYYQEQPRAGVEISGQSAIVKLIAINVAVFVADILANDRLMPWLMASPNSLAHPWRIWQLLTYGFAHDRSDIAHIVLNMFGLFVLGRDVESVYGGKELVRIYLTTLVLGGFLWAVRGLLTMPQEAWEAGVVGASGAVTAIILLFCLHFPQRTLLFMFVLPVPAWAFGLLIIVLNVLGLFSQNSHTAFDVHLVGAAFAICYYKFGWHLGRWTPALKPPRRWLKLRPRLKLHAPSVPQEDLDAEADQLLAKVRREGMDSLTAGERRALEEYSRRMRKKHR